jgi:calpain-15
MNLIKRFILNADNDNSNEIMGDYRQSLVQQWTCNTCSFSANDISKLKCEMCQHANDTGASSSGSTQKIWKCKVCTLINSYNDTKCDVCEANRDDKISNNDDSVIILDEENENYEIIKNGWICKQCTFINNKLNDKCDICGLFNNIIRNERITTAKLWTCDLCSSKNRNIKSNVCEVCGYSMHTSLINRQNTSFDNSLDTSSLKSSRTQQAKAINDIYLHSIEEAVQLWKNIVSYCQKNKHKFIDDGFPPCDKSLFSDEKTKEKVLGRKIRAIQWLHPEQIKVRNEDQSFKWTVYLKNPTFHDIKQGHLGNCWFLSALAVILDRPEIIQKILVTKEFCPEGCYLVRLCHNGEWKIVMIDDLFPCDENAYLLYSKAHKRQLWVALIEKALAKLNKSYEALIAGHTIEGLSTLTGYPCESIR